MDFDHENFPLLAKDNSALDVPNLPEPISQGKKDTSVRSAKSNKSNYSLGFSKNV